MAKYGGAEEHAISGKTQKKSDNRFEGNADDS